MKTRSAEITGVLKVSVVLTPHHFSNIEQPQHLSKLKKDVCPSLMPNAYFHKIVLIDSTQDKFS